MKKSISAWRVGAPLCSLVAIGAAAWVLRAPAAVPPMRENVSMAPERIARGQYVYQVAGCDNCHSPRDWDRFAGPVLAHRRGAGFEFPADMALPGRVVAGNITSDRETGIGEWTDGEKVRAIRDGIGRNGHALYPLMPYRRYRNMSDDDVFSLVAYLNTLPPVRNEVPPTNLSLPAALRVKSKPRPAGYVAPLDKSNPVRYGEYLAGLAGCQQCHTAPPGLKRFAGGRRFTLYGKTAFSANISPDPGTGIGRWSEQDFLDRIYLYREYVETESPKVGPENFTVMPWLTLTEWKPEDLKAVYAYLRTQKPVYQFVQPHPLELIRSKPD